MLVARYTLPFMYEEGTRLTSSQSRNLVGTGTNITIPVGETIVMQEDMEKVQTIEYLGDIRVERYFLRCYFIDEDELIPVYIKFIDASGAHVVLVREGIEYALNALAITPDRRVRFLKSCLFDVVVDETYCLDRELYNTLKECYDAPSHFRYLSEDSAVYLPDSNNEIIYPWNIVNYDNSAFKIYVENKNNSYVSNISNSLYDLSVQVNLNDVGYNAHPISSWIDSIFGLDLGEYYKIAFDPLSQECLRNGALLQKDINKHLGGIYYKNFHLFSKDNNNKDIYQPIEEFTSELLLLCVWVHNLPYTEIIFKYILLNRRLGRRANFTCSIPNGVAHIDIRPLEYILNNIWGNLNISSVVVMVNGKDEMFLEVYEESGIVHKYYIDLFLTTLLSQSIVRLPEETLC